jgi:HAD superfamily hydrolase (TIGR01458 family)
MKNKVAKTIMNNFLGIIFDIDGVLEYQGKTYPGATGVVSSLREKGIKLRFLTNSTLKSRASCAERLREHSFEVYDEEVITASYATAEYLRQVKPRSIWVMLERQGLDEFKDFPQDENDPEYLVIGDNRSRFDFETLNRALRVLKKGAKLIGMQNELIDSSMGELELNVGSWVRMLESASGVEAVYIGKPFPYAIELATRSLGMSGDKVLMVGDRVLSDIQGARNSHLHSALVKTGEYRPGDLKGETQPDWILEDIRQLLSLFP